MASVLPEEFHDDIPSGFNTAGHVGNYLRPQLFGRPVYSI